MISRQRRVVEDLIPDIVRHLDHPNIARKVEQLSHKQQRSRNAVDPSLGAEIRSRRKSKSLKVKDLAKAAGITQSALSQIENGHVHPSVPTLRRIAAALGMSVFDLADDKLDQKPVVVTAANRKTLGLPGSPVTYQLLTPDLKGRLEVLYFEVGPGEVTFEGGASHAGEECLFIIEGSGRLELNGETYELESGDAITFSSDVAHAIRNTSQLTLTAVSAITPPNF